MVKDITCLIDEFVESLAFIWKEDPLDGDQAIEIAEYIRIAIQNQLDEYNGNVARDDSLEPIPIDSREYFIDLRFDEKGNYRQDLIFSEEYPNGIDDRDFFINLINGKSRNYRD